MPNSAFSDELIAAQPPALDGRINDICRYHDHDGQRFILIRGVSFYFYDLGDRFAESHVWISLHLAGYAKMSEIARGTHLSARSLQRKKTMVQKHGFEALLPKPIPGRPRTITTTVKRKALRLINQGGSRSQVSEKLGISPSSLDLIIAEDKAKNSPTHVAQNLDFQEDLFNETAPQQPETILAQEPKHETAAAPKASPDFEAGICTDPLDRSLDRAMAKAGLIEDADPLFAPGERIDCLGFFMAIALLDRYPLLDIFEKFYGKALGPAFHGLRTTVMTILMMTLLRIKRPEHLRQYNPVNLGRVLGLDRIMEVKTMRRKLHTLAEENKGIELMEELGKARINKRPAPVGNELKILYIDGHVQCYHGTFKIGQTWSATRNRVVKGRTDTWLHLPEQTPLFYLESSFNEGLVSMIESNRDKIEHAMGSKPVLVFDRECWDVDFLNELNKAGWKFITYRKGDSPDWPLADFAETETEIGKRTYAHAPVDRAVQSYNLYQTETGNKGGETRKLTGKVNFREIRILSDDKTHQTAIVTNLEATRAGAEKVCAAIFSRWGDQENVFKYMIEEFGLDHLVEYNRNEGKGSESRRAEEHIPGAVDHPNPDYKKLTSEILKLAGEQTRLLVRYGLVLEKEVTASEGGGEIDPKVLTGLIEKIKSAKDRGRLKNLTRELQEKRARRAGLERREGASSAGYKQLRSGVRQITNSIKMVAYDLENQLYRMLAPHYMNHDKEGRKLIAAALRSKGSLRLKGGKIIVQLEAQSSPNRTAAINAICRELNHREAKYPGTDLVIEFDTAR